MSPNGSPTPEDSKSQEQLAAEITAVLKRHPAISAAIEEVEVSLEALGELQQEMLASREKGLIDPTIEKKTFDAQKKIALCMDVLVGKMQGVTDQKMIGIAMGTHGEANAYLQSIVFSIHYARHAQKHGHDRINERIFTEAFTLLQRQQGKMVAQQGGKIIIP